MRHALTVVRQEYGLAYVFVDRVLVGDVLSGFASWTCRLLAEGGNLHGGWAGQVDGRRLKDVRAQLRERLEADGPWWVVPEAATRRCEDSTVPAGTIAP